MVRGVLSWMFVCLCFVLQAQDVSEIEAYIESARNAWNIPGMAVGVIVDGQVVLAKGFGSLEAGGHEKVDRHTNFAIASNTKAFTAAALGILVDEGKLSWDDPVQQHLPTFQLADPWETKHITVRDLLCHRAGYGSFSGDVVWFKSERSAGEVIKSLPYVPKAFDFRSGYGYSNMMYIAAGEVIRAVSGQPWDAFIEARILDPLEMERTVTSTRVLSRMTNIATPHKPNGTNNEPIDWANWDNMSTGGAIISNVDDMLRWFELQLNAGSYNEHQIFSRAVQETWWMPHNNYMVNDAVKTLFPMRNFAGYGLGWSLQDYYGLKLAMHGGGYDGMYSKVVLCPSEKIGIVVLTNSMKSIGSWLPYSLIDMLKGFPDKDWCATGLERHNTGVKNMEERKDLRRKARVVGTNPIQPTSAIVGEYEDAMYRRSIRVTEKDGTIHLTFDDAPALSATLEHWHYDTYQIQWNETQAWFDFGTIRFVSDNNQEVVGIEFDVPNGDIFFHEIKATKKKDTAH